MIPLNFFLGNQMVKKEIKVASQQTDGTEMSKKETPRELIVKEMNCIINITNPRSVRCSDCFAPVDSICSVCMLLLLDVIVILKLFPP